MLPTTLSRDFRTPGRHGPHRIRVQIERETFSTETLGLQMPIAGHLSTAARDRPISPSDGRVRPARECPFDFLLFGKAATLAGTSSSRGSLCVTNLAGIRSRWNQLTEPWCE
jgi:hypothetical protein